MRWQEEVTLTTYEMQWMVRYFKFMSRKWSDKADTLAESISIPPHVGNPPAEGNHSELGSIAYAKQKMSAWQCQCEKSDRTLMMLTNHFFLLHISTLLSSYHHQCQLSVFSICLTHEMVLLNT